MVQILLMRFRHWHKSSDLPMRFITRHIIYLSLIIGLSTESFGQEAKEIVISRAHRQVPDGKVWFISNQQDHKVLFSEGALQSGTFCYASLYSNPRHVFGISYLENLEHRSRRPKTIGFTFRSMEETIGSDVYLIKPHFILHHENGIDDVKNSLSWDFELMQVVFYPGTVVFTNGCIAEITVVERELTEAGKSEYQKHLKR
ncbi:hypothetical protein [Parapedobacter sp. 2B3]|uniref:hypothetical protein n=1 Tax=Parapedobacter sp. 2B3 TaxID=3342381 RepID=UPI0035B5AD0D